MQREHAKILTLSNILKTAVLASGFAALCILRGDILLKLARIFLGAGIIAFLLMPLAKLYARRLPQAVAALLALLSAIVAILAALWLLLPVLSRQFSMLSQTLPDVIRRVQAMLAGFAAWVERTLPDIKLPDAAALLPAENFSGLARSTISYAGTLAGSLYQFSLMIVLSFFFMSQRERVLLRMELAIPAGLRRMAVRMGNGILRELRLYIRGQLIIALSVGVLASAGLMLVGVPGALLLGLIVGIFNLIPYLGPLLGSIPAVLMALSTSWQRAVFAALVLFLIQQIDSLVLSPRIMGSITGFSPAIILVALFVGSQAGGVWGMLFAMPVLMSIRTVYRVFVQRHENN